MLKKHINIFAFADEASSNIDEQIIALKRNGLNGLEIRGVDGENISDISLSKAKEVKSKLDAQGLITWSIGSPIGKINITDDFKKHLEKFKYTLDIADALDCKNIRIFSFYIPQEQKPENFRNEVIERLGAFLETAKETGITLCHENEKGIYGDTPERCLDIYKTLPEMKGIFDPANFVQCGVDTLKAWDMLKSYIHYMHIKDSKKDGTVVLSGYGDGNIAEIANKYIAMGGSHFTMEPHLAVFDGLKNLERENEKSVISQYTYSDNNTAFDVACESFKNIILKGE